jgi:hypothetical protein
MRGEQARSSPLLMAVRTQTRARFGPGIETRGSWPAAKRARVSLAQRFHVVKSSVRTKLAPEEQGSKAATDAPSSPSTSNSSFQATYVTNEAILTPPTRAEGPCRLAESRSAEYGRWLRLICYLPPYCVSRRVRKMVVGSAQLTWSTQLTQYHARANLISRVTSSTIS